MSWREIVHFPANDPYFSLDFFNDYFFKKQLDCHLSEPKWSYGLLATEKNTITQFAN